MTAVLHLTRLRCVRPDDSASDGDEVKLQIDGQQIWPNRDEGFFNMGTDHEVPMDISHVFRGGATVSLFDDEDVGHDGRLGALSFSEDVETPGGATFHGESGSVYELSYEIPARF
ncbi:hypothetical protein ACWD0J_33610 [Streptomyces sp. NPDC003011]